MLPCTRQLGVDETMPGDPLFVMVKQTARDACEYRKRYREHGDFTSVASQREKDGRR